MLNELQEKENALSAELESRSALRRRQDDLEDAAADWWEQNEGTSLPLNLSEKLKDVEREIADSFLAEKTYSEEIASLTLDGFEQAFGDTAPLTAKSVVGKMEAM